MSPDPTPLVSLWEEGDLDSVQTQGDHVKREAEPGLSPHGQGLFCLLGFLGTPILLLWPSFPALRFVF